MKLRTSENGLALIRRFEGFSATPYRCPAGYLTVGYGHVIKTEQFPTITVETAERLLAQDVYIAEGAVGRLISEKLNQNQWDALASFTFNLGAVALQRSALRACINRGDHAGAAEQFGRWVYAGGRKLPGLITRRNAEKTLYQGG